MRRFFKWAFIALVVLLIVAAVAAAFNWRKIKRLYAVNTLFDEANIVGNFSSMQDLFFWTPIANTGDVEPWPEALRPLPAELEFGGVDLALDEWLTETRTTSLVVVHDGTLTHEEYRLGTGRGDRRISWSVAKSFVSAMFGIAVAEGKITGLDQKVTDYVPELAGTAYDGVTIRNALNMSTGVKFDEDYLDYNSDINRMGRVLALGRSMDSFAAGLKERSRDPGSVRQYTSIDTHVLAMILRRATGKSLPQLIDEKIVGPIGFEADPYYLTDGYGVAFALGGLNLSSRDYARFGQMFLDFGQWDGKQIVPRDWAIRSVMPSAPLAAKADNYDYGYQWWIPNDAGEGEFLARGIYGQFIYVNRPASTVIVKTSANRKFREPGVMELELAGMRAIAAGVSGWRPTANAGQ